MALKFKENDVVYDIPTGLIGTVKEYLGNGLYALKDIRCPVYDSVSHEFLGMVNLNYNDLVVPLPDREIRGLLVQHSRHINSVRFLENSNDYLEKYNNPISLDFNDTYLDSFDRLSKITEPPFISFRGGNGPYRYSLFVYCFEYWRVNCNFGYANVRKIKSVSRCEYNAPRQFSINPQLTVASPETVEYIINWEREISPYAINGEIL